MEPTPAKALFRICLFGGVRIETPTGVSADFGSNKNRSLLTYLALRMGRSTTRDQAVSALWPGADLDSGRNRLSTALVAIRKVLTTDGVCALVSDRTHLSLDPIHCSVDVDQFLRLHNRAGQESGADAIPALEAALALYTSTVASEIYDDWIIPDQSRIAQLYDQAIRRLAQLLGEAGRVDAVAALVHAYEVLGDDQEVLWDLRRCLPGSPARPRDKGQGRFDVPLPAEPFLGREEDLQKLHETLQVREPGRVVTLTGVGGVGKSSIVRGYWAQFGDNTEAAIYLPMNQVASLDSLIHLVAEAFGLPANQPKLEDRLLDRVADQRALLVLDGFEHLPAPCDRWVRRLAQTAPGIAILITSRRPLAIAGQLAVPVRPLALAESESSAKLSTAALCLLTLLRRVQPDFDVSAEGRAHLERICNHVAGLPLALQHMAKRARYLSLADLSRRLEERGGTRFGAVVAETYEALPPTARELWNVLACYSGAIPTEAMRFAAAHYGEKALNDLADVGIFKQAVVGMGTELELFDLYREEVLAIMEPPVRSAARAQWAAFWVAWLDEREKSLSNKTFSDVVDRYHRDIVSVARALNPDHAVEYMDRLYYLWLGKGRGFEPMRILQLLTKRMDKMAPASQVKLIFLRAIFEGFTGNPEASHASLAQCRERIADCGPDLAARILHQSVWSAARPSHEELVRQEAQAKRPGAKIEAILALASNATIEGNVNLAIAEFERALALAKTSGHAYFICSILREIGWLNLRQGRLRKSEESLTQHRRLLADSLGERAASGPLGYVRGLLGHYAEGLEELDRTEALERSANYTLSVSHALMWKGLLNVDLGRLKLARQNLDESLQIVIPWNDENVEVTLYAGLAECALALGETDQAELAIANGRRAIATRMPLERAQNLLDLAEARLAATFGNRGIHRERIGSVAKRAIAVQERTALIAALELAASHAEDETLACACLRAGLALRHHIGLAIPPLRRSDLAETADRLGVPLIPVGVLWADLNRLKPILPEECSVDQLAEVLGAVVIAD